MDELRVSGVVLAGAELHVSARTCLVFHAAWAVLTFCWAVSHVKGGKGGLDSVAMVMVIHCTDLVVKTRGTVQN